MNAIFRENPVTVAVHAGEKEGRGSAVIIAITSDYILLNDENVASTGSIEEVGRMAAGKDEVISPLINALMRQRRRIERTSERVQEMAPRHISVIGSSDVPFDVISAVFLTVRKASFDSISLEVLK